MTTLEVELAGASTATGALAATLRLNRIALLAGSSPGSGSVAFTSTLFAGALLDWAMTPVLGEGTYVDPVFSNVTSVVTRADTDGTAWKHLSITAYPPSDYAPGPAGQLYRRASYLRPWLYWYALRPGDTQLNAYAQVERTPNDASMPLGDQVGINRLDAEQGSYEGRVFYAPDPRIPGISYTRSREYVLCGEYAGRLRYTKPPGNTYQLVKSFETYSNVLARRVTYADVRYTPWAPGEEPTGPGNDGGTVVTTSLDPTPVVSPTVFSLVPTTGALVDVLGGTPVTASIAMASRDAGLTGKCAVVEYDDFLTPIATTPGAAVTLTAGYRWSRAVVALTLNTATVKVAVVPVITGPGPVDTLDVCVDSHRFYTPTYLASAPWNAGAAQPWRPPREVIVKVAADRVNYCRNPSFATDEGYRATYPAGTGFALALVHGGGYEGGEAMRYHHDTMIVSSVTGTGGSGWVGIATDDALDPTP